MKDKIFLITTYAMLAHLGENMNNVKYIVEGNWDEIKGRVKKYWGKLTDDQLEQINGSYDSLIGELTKIYGYSSNEVEKQLEEFFNSSDFDQIKKKAMDKMNELRSMVVSTVEEYYKTAKDKSVAAEKAITEYASENPFKTIGIAAAVGFLMGYLCNKK